jgi:hypothetical protein
MMKIYGADRYRLMLFGTKVQQSLSTTCHKRLTNLISDNSLDGLVIDWQFANSEMVSNDFVEPVSNYEPTYAYA